MTDYERLLQEMIAERDYISSRLKAMDDLIAKFEKAREVLSDPAASSVIPDLRRTITASFLSAVRESPQSSTRAATAEEVAVAAREAMLAAGVSMTRSQVVTALEAKGMVLPGQDKAKNLGTILWRRSDLFVKAGARGYWVKGEPLPEK